MTLKLRLDSTSARRAAWAGGCFVLVGLDVMSGGLISSFDSIVRDWVQPQPGAVDSWLDVAGDLGEQGVSAALLGIAGAVASHLLWKLWPLVFVVALFLSTQALVYLTKWVVGREGPGAWADRAGYPGYYPSGHTTTAAVCAGSVVFLVLVTRLGASCADRAATWGSVAGLLAGALAAVYSIMGDSHWFSDGVGGLLLAYCILSVAFALVPANTVGGTG